MREPLYYEDVTEGDGLPSLVKEPTTRQLVMWAGASGDYHAIHYDKDYAQNKGLSGVIVHGQLVAGFLGQLMTDWLGESGIFRKFSCNYRGMNYPGEVITCGGKVTRKYIEDGQHYIQCSIWAENAKGEKTVTGKATVILPSRTG